MVEVQDLAGAGKLRVFEIFRELPDNVLADIEDVLEWRRLSEGHRLVDGSSARPHGVYFLSEGEVEIFRKDGNGAKIVMARKEAVAFFGEIGALSGTPGSASVSTVKESLVAELPAEQFVDLCCQHQQATLHVLRQVAGNVRRLDAEVERLNLAENLLQRLFNRSGLLL